LILTGPVDSQWSLKDISSAARKPRIFKACPACNIHFGNEKNECKETNNKKEIQKRLQYGQFDTSRNILPASCETFLRAMATSVQTTKTSPKSRKKYPMVIGRNLKNDRSPRRWRGVGNKY
jgi:hypothetical protein